MNHPRHNKSFGLRKIAGSFADSFVLSKGRKIFERNKANFHCPLSKFEKFCCGLYLILRDYSKGIFPPQFEDESKAFKAEIDYGSSLPGIDEKAFKVFEIRKPFWTSPEFLKHAEGLARLANLLDHAKIEPGSRLLELGCGSGWIAEFFALMGYNVVGTSIAPLKIELATSRAAALTTKGVKSNLQFVVSSMESVHEAIEDECPFDAIYVYEALHHAFDWQKAIESAARCCRKGGCLVIANEPNVLHTFISYRVAKLAKTHEIGMNGGRIRQQLRSSGFLTIRTVQPSRLNPLSSHWIVATK